MPVFPMSAVLPTAPKRRFPARWWGYSDGDVMCHPPTSWHMTSGPPHGAPSLSIPQPPALAVPPSVVTSLNPCRKRHHSNVVENLWIATAAAHLLLRTR